MKYIIRKIVDAKDIKDAIKKEKSVKPLEIYMTEDDFKSLSITEVKRKIGFNKK